MTDKPPVPVPDLAALDYLTRACPNMIMELHDSPAKLMAFAEIMSEIMSLHVMCVRLDYALKTKMLMAQDKLTPDTVERIIARLNADINKLTDSIGPKMQLVEITKDPTRIVN